ncbi:hypothetical protein N781_18280 [Pontibacillus halophilus JSM 076056 = DSM 19796]|uniref:Sulfurtransferase n=1 Tax=Pontibacillus halophilus JSM 076056 = DSM 19796 TaxID=1385510 RepID=A0A0A5I8S8_9BACI|nr:YqkE family protein [Pontibacillus halophilus]KGX92242.1 hypothetical protein N781_18280 [Pontibacillus halophilus JSM 076056 = DSM 19796]
MAKKKKEEYGTLKDSLNEDLLKQLQSKKADLKQQAEQREEEEKQRRIKEKKRREANKSFEELLDESNMDWSKFK